MGLGDLAKREVVKPVKAEKIVEAEKKIQRPKAVGEFAAQLQDPLKEISHLVGSRLRHHVGETSKGYKKVRNLMVIAERIEKSLDKPVGQSEFYSLMHELLDGLEALPEMMRKSTNPRLSKKEFLADKIDGKPSEVLPILAELYILHAHIRDELIHGGHEEFADKPEKTIKYPNPWLGAAGGILGVAGALSLAHMVKLDTQAEGKPKDVETSHLVIRDNKESKGEKEIVWVDLIGKSENVVQKFSPVREVENGVIAKKMDSKEGIAKSEYFSDELASGVVSGVAGALILVFSVIFASEKTIIPRNKLQKIDDELQNPENGEPHRHLHKYLAEKEEPSSESRER